MSLRSARRERCESGFGALRGGTRRWKVTATSLIVLDPLWYLGRIG